MGCLRFRVVGEKPEVKKSPEQPSKNPKITKIARNDQKCTRRGGLIPEKKKVKPCQDVEFFPSPKLISSRDQEPPPKMAENLTNFVKICKISEAARLALNLG